MIDNIQLESILDTATDISILAEIYGADAVPGASGFDPVNAIDCFAAVDGIVFRTRTYKKLVAKFGSIKRTITSEINTTSITFNNLSREMSQFEFTNGFEGLILVVRMISRSQSIVLSDSQILFAGRCDKPKSGTKESLSVSAKFILGSLDVTCPRRKFTKEDAEGRVPTDPLFEGFLFIPQYGTTSYSVRVKRGGLLGFLGFKKTVKVTLNYSSFSDLDANKYLPEVLGRGQLLGVHIGYDDLGSAIRLRTAFCEGEISDIQNARSTDTNFPLSTTSYAEYYGKIGILNVSNPAWVAPGTYSRTAHIEGQANNSAVDVTDPAPDVAAIILGRKITTPNLTTGVWNTVAWSDDAAAHSRFLLTSPDYYKLDVSWIDDADAFESFKFNTELIFNKSISDFIFVEQG